MIERVPPRVSVVVIFLEAERFLKEAIDSVKAQSLQDLELILVDDGSTDGSSEIARAEARGDPDRIFYVEHPGHANRGMSASRNLGLSRARGEFVAFLDADDVWLPDKLAREVERLRQCPDAAFLYSPALYWFSWTGRAEDATRDFVQDLAGPGAGEVPAGRLAAHFLGASHATPATGGVLVRRAHAQAAGGFVESFRGLYEDQVFFWKLALRHSVVVSAEPSMRYRQHDGSASERAFSRGEHAAARRRFLEWAAAHLREQRIRDPELEAVLQRELTRAVAETSPGRALKRSLGAWLSPALRGRLKRLLGPSQTARLRCLMRGLGLPRWGNLRRVEPFSANFGFERGTPLDRFYLERFLEENRGFIKGDLLEIQLVGYTQRYGSGVRVAHSVDINPAHAATYTCDLAACESVIPSDRYDCFLLPNTLCVLRDIEACLRQALRVVKPGGVILATTAGFVPLTSDASDYWHLSADGWRELASRAWPGCEVRIESHGNCLAAVAAMLGLAYEELRPEELRVVDPRYPVLLTLFCRKPLGPR